MPSPIKFQSFAYVLWYAIWYMYVYWDHSIREFTLCSHKKHFHCVAGLIVLYSLDK